MRFNVKVENFDESLLLKKTVIKVGSKTIMTPTKTLFKIKEESVIRDDDVKKLFDKNNIKETFVNEIYKKFSVEKLNKCLSSEFEERKINSLLKNSLSSGLNIFIPEFSDKNFSSNKQLELLSDLQYSHSDVVVTPVLQGLFKHYSGESLFENFIEITNNYLKIVETLNHKPVFGLLPLKMPRQFLEEVFKNYYDKNITSFVLDFSGRSIDSNSSWMRLFFRLLKDYDLIESSVLKGININKGRFLKNKKEILAKDFVSVGFGIDIVGENHVPLRMPSEAWEKIKSQRKENIFRVFNKDTYGYSKRSYSELNSLGIQKNNLNNFNSLEQFKETKVLQKVLKEDNTVETYLNSKVNVVEENMIKKIKAIRSSAFKI